MSRYKVYMTRYAGTTWEEPVDLEASYKGLFYYKCTGLNAKGEPRVYTEEYAEKDGVRVFIPDNTTRKSTEIVLELLFKGDDRQTVFQSFCDYITGRKLRFWDTERKRMAEMFLSGAVSVSEESISGTTPFFIASFTFTTYNGTTVVKETVQSITS